MKRTLLVALSLSLLSVGCSQEPGGTTGSTPPPHPPPATSTGSPSTDASPSPDAGSPSPDASGSPTTDAGAPTPPKKGETGKEKGPDGLTFTITKKSDEKKTVAKGDTIRVHYTGWLTDGTKFDSSLDRGEPIDFPIGVGRVIPGWDEGIPGMKVGETRRLYIPSKMGYGETGTPGGPIPPNADLVFEVNLVDIPGKE